MEHKTSSRSKKIAIYSAAFLMMGAVGVSSSLTVIGEHFASFSQTRIAALITAVCVMVIPVTIVTGILMRYISKKILLLCGIVLFILGGVLPFFMDNFYLILAMRCVFGVGIGLIQTVDPAIIADSYEGAEKNSVQGTATAFQMTGLIVMSILGGKLGAIQWNKTFLLHLLGLIPLILVLICLPNEGVNKNHTREASVHFPAIGFVWPIICCIFYIGGQTFSLNLSNLLLERHLVDSIAQSATTAGSGLAAFAIGGLVMGFIYGRINQLLGPWTLCASYILLLVSFLLLILAPNTAIILSASVLAGFAFSAAMAYLYVETGNVVGPALAAMALAFMTCLQNVGQFLCPYVVNNVGHVICGDSGVNRGAYLFSVIILAVLAIIVPVVKRTIKH